MGPADALNNVDREAKLQIAVKDDAPIGNVLIGLANSILRGNAARAKGGKQKMVLRSITVEVATVDLTDEDAALLRAADLMGYRDHDEFMAPEEVTMFFHRDTLRMHGVHTEMTDETLARIASLVIRTRSHCSF